MSLGDHGKLIVFLVIVAGSFASVLTHTVDWAQGSLPVMAVFSYLAGNGLLARFGGTSSPALTAKQLPLPPTTPVQPPPA